MAHRDQAVSDIDVLRASLGAETLPAYLDWQDVQAAEDAARRWPRLVAFARRRAALAHKPAGE